MEDINTITSLCSQDQIHMIPPCNGNIVSSVWTKYFDLIDINSAINIFYSKYDKKERYSIACSDNGDIIAIIIKNVGLTGKISILNVHININIYLLS